MYVLCIDYGGPGVIWMVEILLDQCDFDRILGPFYIRSSGGIEKGFLCDEEEEEGEGKGKLADLLTYIYIYIYIFGISKRYLYKLRKKNEKWDCRRKIPRSGK